MRRPAKLLRVIDGDTLHVEVDLGFNFFTRQKLRLARVDAPEMPTIQGQLSREFVIFTLKELIALEIDAEHNEKFGRWLAEVWFKTKGSKGEFVNLNDFLIASPYAKEYAVYNGDA